MTAGTSLPLLELPAGFSALIFDCDGTLVDTAPAHYSAVTKALAAQGQTMPEPWYMERVGLTPAALLDAHEARVAEERRAPDTAGAGETPSRLDRAAFYQCYGGHYLASLPLLREVTLVAEVARRYHGRVPMAVASNGHLENVEASLRVTGLLSLFEPIVAAEHVARGKPAPDLFLEAARRMLVAAKDCVVLEDSDEGVEAAKRAGMRFVDVRPFVRPGSAAGRADGTRVSKG